MNTRRQSLRVWRRWIDDVHTGLQCAGLAIDFFGFRDLQHLFRERRYTPAMVVEHAKQLAEAAR